LNAVRQQFLIWRTLSEEQRARYMSIQEVAAEASEHASGAFANVSEEPG
jgi:hypothetical protein